MERKSIYCAAAIAAALALGAMAGCSGQSASQASSSSGSASAASSASASASQAASSSESTEKSQDQIIAELKDSLAKVPAYKSVTITEKSLSWTNNNAEATAESPSASAASADAADFNTPGETIESATLYKFDESGDQPKTSSVATMGGIELRYYTEGDDAVCATDGPAYSGTVEQFGLGQAGGADAYLKETIGDLDALVDCISSVSQDEINGVMGYELTLDPQKYIQSDEYLTLIAESGDPVKEAYVTVGFDKDGRIVWMTRTHMFKEITSSVLLDLSDFDSTVVDPMPTATKTYEDMEADMQKKSDALDELE